MRGALSALEEPLQSRAGGWPPPTGENWEIGRLVLDPGYRGGPDLVKRCIFLGVSHLAQRTGGRNLFASCSPALARLYRRFGFSVVATDLSVPDSEQPYALIYGDVEKVLCASAGGKNPS